MSHYTRPHEPSEYGGGGGRGGGANYYDPSADFSHAISHANHNRRAEGHGQHGGDSDDEEESSFFSKAVGFISEHKDSLKNEDVDEDRAVGAHQDLYGEGGGKQSHNADSLGGGAAVQALKMFTGGEKGHGDAQGGGGGEHDQNKFIGMAMAQAGKLWNQQNKEGRAVRTYDFPHSFISFFYLSSSRRTYVRTYYV